jgi:hypothetical protein
MRPGTAPGLHEPEIGLRLEAFHGHLVLVRLDSLLWAPDCHRDASRSTGDT